MSFIPTSATTARTRVGPSGSPKAKIAIIGEAPAREEVRQGKPFVGPSGSVLERCLHAAKLTRAEVYITNTIKEPISDKAKWYKEKRSGGILTPIFSETAQPYLEELRAEIEALDANILVPMGAIAHAAVCGRAYLSRYRGYVCEGSLVSRKSLPTFHPATVMHGKYVWQYYIMHDLMKAKRESSTPDFMYPPAEIEIVDTAPEAIRLLKQIRYESPVSVDIEVTNYEVSYIGFSALPGQAFSICLYHSQMTEEEETEVWRHIAAILEDPSIEKIFQNGVFDMQFLAQHNGILTEGFKRDTMIAHSLMYPAFEKDLGFIGSIYTNHPAWKVGVRHGKQEIEKKEG